MIDSAKPALQSERLLSLDFLRGLIMVLLIMSSTGIYDYLMIKRRDKDFSTAQWVGFIAAICIFTLEWLL